MERYVATVVPPLGFGLFPTSSSSGRRKEGRPLCTRTSVRQRYGRWPAVGEASPSYLFHPLAPERVARLMPSARLIAVLRNPVDRAFSHYQHEVALGREKLSFEEALDREDDRMRGEIERMLEDPSYFSHAWWNYTYVARGRYAEQLERWFAAFPREQLLVLVSEELLDQPAETYARVLDFLRVDPHTLRSFPRIFTRDYDEMSAATRAARARPPLVKKSPGDLRPAAGAAMEGAASFETPPSLLSCVRSVAHSFRGRLLPRADPSDEGIVSARTPEGGGIPSATVTQWSQMD